MRLNKLFIQFLGGHLAHINIKCCWLAHVCVCAALFKHNMISSKQGKVNSKCFFIIITIIHICVWVFFSLFSRQYWVCDIAWTYDNLFIACMLANGSAALLSRLGEPLIIATHGCSVEMGPSYFLPLHPFINVV